MIMGDQSTTFQNRVKCSRFAIDHQIKIIKGHTASSISIHYQHPVSSIQVFQYPVSSTSIQYTLSNVSSIQYLLSQVAANSFQGFCDSLGKWTHLLRLKLLVFFINLRIGLILKIMLFQDLCDLEAFCDI